MTKAKENKNSQSFIESHETVLKNKWGQHLLLLLIPFIHPSYVKNNASPIERLIDGLHLKYLSPFIGSGFIVLSFAFMERLLLKKYINVFSLLNLDSVSVVYHTTIFLSLVSFSLAVARYSSGYVMKYIFHIKHFYNLPFSYWCARYAGIMVYSGFLVWIINGFLFVHPGLTGFLIFSIGFICLFYWGIREIFNSFDALRRSMDHRENRIMSIYEYTVFFVLAVLLSVVYILCFKATNL